MAITGGTQFDGAVTLDRGARQKAAFEFGPHAVGGDETCEDQEPDGGVLKFAEKCLAAAHGDLKDERNKQDQQEDQAALSSVITEVRYP
jgi:hypothetical protein